MLNFDKLFTTRSINNLTLHNSLVVAPMTRVSASEDGIASERMRSYYQDFIRGGFSLIITEGIYIDQKWSQTYQFQAGITNDEQAQAWKLVTQAVHVRGGKIFAQIQHSGALSQGNFFNKGSVGPSAVRPKGEQLSFYRGEGEYPIPRELDEIEIHEIIQSFADAAERAINSAGFDGIEIHGANGYLLDQFLTDYSNTRTDKWGGNTANRLRLSLEVIKAVRKRLGKEIPVGIRISQGKVNDFFHKWVNGEEDAKTVFEALANSGVDYIHVTEFEAWQPAFKDNQLSFVQLARKYAPDLVIIANGSLHIPERAVQILNDGADFIAIGRGALANHNWPLLIQNRQEQREFDRGILMPIADIKDKEFSNF